jgi:hypothetical protein
VTPPRRAAALVLGLLAAGCSRERERSPTPPQAGPATPTASPRDPAPAQVCDVATAMNVLAGGVLGDEAVRDWCARLERDPAAVEAFADALVASPSLGATVLPGMIFNPFLDLRNYYALPTGFNLMRSSPDKAGRTTYFIRAPCTPAQATPVRPWWDPSTKVLVCGDAYQPDRWEVGTSASAYHSTQILACDSQTGSPENEVDPACGCGPNLIRCLRDEEQYLAMLTSLADEIRQTTAWVYAHDLPIDALFTGNETYRDRNVELYYRRQAIGTRKQANVLAALADLATWPEEGKFARREVIAPGQHAGLLTAPQILHWLPDRRQRQRGFFEILWCAGRLSFGATTEQVLALNAKSANLAFVHDSWQKLASTELCTSCHARLDYGFQFLHGYPDSRASIHYVPSLALPGDGPLYGDSIDDLRGRGPLTPLGFAQLATAQPEFLECMADHLASYTLGERVLAADRSEIVASLRETRRLRPAVRTALLAFARRALSGGDARPRGRAGSSAAATPTPAPPGQVAIDGALRAAVDRHCVGCHDEVPVARFSVGSAMPFDLRGPALPRALVIRMADDVAYGRMPKAPGELSPIERRALADLLVRALFPDPAARADAEAYFGDALRALPALPIERARALVSQAAGSRTSREVGSLEKAVHIDQATLTPGFITISALEALLACRESGERGSSLDGCLDRALVPQNLVRGTLGGR